MGRIAKIKESSREETKGNIPNTGIPAAKGFKANVQVEEKRSNKQLLVNVGREDDGRQLSETPDQIIKATVKSCAGCGKEIGESGQILMEQYDKIEILPT